MPSRFFRLLVGLSLALGCTLAAQAQNYTPVNPAQPSDTPGKIEVLDFFAYSCVHCNAMEPLTARWEATLPENVVLKRVPVAFNASMIDLQRLYYTLEALDRLDLHPAVFRAIHAERKRIFTASTIIDWAADQGIDRQEFESTFNSFGVQMQTERANNLWRTYGIEGTPTFGVGGRFITSPSQNASYEATLVQVQALLNQILSQQN